MRYLQSSAIWTAVLSVAAGTACIVAFLSGVSPRSYVLMGAEAAAAIGALWLLVSALVIYLLTRRRSGANPALRRLSAGHGDCAASLRRRLEILDERLNIDEPRLCSQNMVACTCWSFCAGSEGKRPIGEGTSPAVRKLVAMPKRPPEAKGLQLVIRNETNGCCPFRYASPLARSVPGDGVAPNASDFGAATP